MKKIVYIISIIILFASCGNKEKDQQGFVVNGKIINSIDKTIYLQELTSKGLKFIDSTTIKPDGTFEFKGNVSDKLFATISFPKGAAVIVLDTNSTISLSIDADAPEQYGVTGSPDSETLRKLLQINNKYMQIMRNMETKYAQYGNGDVPPVAIQNQIRNEYDSIVNVRKIELQNFVMSLDKSIISYFATNFLMPESDFEFLEKVDQKFYAQLSSSKYAQEHHAKLTELRKTAVGQSAPDIVLSDPFGKTVALSSLRGKYVLVDFWASWCKPCREESPNLVKMYNKYKTRGFDVFSVSLDDNREAWQKAINDDKLLWTHVSDLMKWNSSVVNLYKIEAIPFTVLLDKEGKIIAKNLRGEKLDAKLSELFK
jgi:peroxiredoxin